MGGRDDSSPQLMTSPGAVDGVGGHGMKRLGKHQSASGELPPFPDPSLQRPHLTDREVTGVFTTEPLEEFFARSMGFGFEPRHDARPCCLERIRASSPVPRRLRSSAMRGPDLAVSPGVLPGSGTGRWRERRVRTPGA